MKNAFLGIVAAGVLSAQSVGGPVLGYVVDGEARLRPVNGYAAAAHVGAAAREQVRDSWGNLALLGDGSALRNGTALEGRWASVHPGAFLDSTAREALVAADGAAPWRLALPLPALSIRVSPSGARVATLLSDESIAVWSQGGKAEFRLPASKWWSLAFAGDRLLAYDPVENAIIQLDGANGPSLLRRFDGPGGRFALAVDGTNTTAILLGERLLLAPLAGGDVREFTPPEGAQRLEAMQGGRVFLLTRDPARPMWLLDTERADGLLIIPAIASEKGAQQ